MRVVDEILIGQFKFSQSRPQTPLSHEEKWPGEASRISWANTRSCNSVTQQHSKHFADNLLKKVRVLNGDEQIFAVAREIGT